jgi:endogenous inhibitor of DNA gyrase (YacG/DUF329 family)
VNICTHCQKPITHRLIVQRRKYCSMSCQRIARNVKRNAEAAKRRAAA